MYSNLAYTFYHLFFNMKNEIDISPHPNEVENDNIAKNQEIRKFIENGIRNHTFNIPEDTIRTAVDLLMDDLNVRELVDELIELKQLDKEIRMEEKKPSILDRFF
ncbi:MAG: hypothetical protein LCI00_19235 [Chloroflexi bacterium]|nr:hypothetical protein [Chloroflexota bacterium]MCC6894143.1 hypothetical protein [Anaerolineae bacterium]